MLNDINWSNGTVIDLEAKVNLEYIIMRSLKLIQLQDLSKIVRNRLKREAIVPYFTMVGNIKNGSFWLRFPTQILYQNATEELRNVCGRST